MDFEKTDRGRVRDKETAMVAAASFLESTIAPTTNHKRRTVMITPPTVTITIAKQKLDVEAEYRALITGMNTVYANVDPYRLNGQDMPKAEVLAKFQSRVDAAEATKAARAALRASVAKEKAVDKEVKPLRSGMKHFIVSREGQGSPVLQAFGFPEVKTPKTKPAVRASAALKAKATREARGTKGRKQKAAYQRWRPDTPQKSGP
jgi:hypothetical protein